LTAAGFTHCPNCLAEYGAWSTICLDCGTALVPGPSPAQEGSGASTPGRVEVVERAGDTATGSADRFALEEVPVVLTSMVEEDTDAFLAALDEEEIGARRGQPTDDGGVEIVVHAANLIDAQALLVEFTGDVSLVDDIGVEGDQDFALVTSVRLADVGARANRLRERGMDVRIDDLERAREILGIAF
jgi:hypothetical protein